MNKMNCFNRHATKGMAVLTVVVVFILLLIEFCAERNVENTRKTWLKSR